MRARGGGARDARGSGRKKRLEARAEEARGSAGALATCLLAWIPPPDETVDAMVGALMVAEVIQKIRHALTTKK